MTAIIRIDADGTVIRIHGNDLAAAASAAWPLTGIVTLRPHENAPFPDPTRHLVMAIDDMAALAGAPVNRKAWSLYGRSPICGDVFISFDLDDNELARDELPDEWIDQLAGPPTWISYATTPSAVRLRRRPRRQRERGRHW